MAKVDTWHRAVPGPLYWDYRCLRCGENVDAHPKWWRRLYAALKRQGTW